MRESRGLEVRRSLSNVTQAEEGNKAYRVSLKRKKGLFLNPWAKWTQIQMTNRGLISEGKWGYKCST